MALALQNRRRRSRANAGFPGRASAYRGGWQKFFAAERRKGRSMKAISADWKKIKRTASNRGLTPKKSASSRRKTSRKGKSASRKTTSRKTTRRLTLQQRLAGFGGKAARRSALKTWKSPRATAHLNGRRSRARRNGLALLPGVRLNPSLRGISQDVIGYGIGTAVPAVAIFIAMDKLTPILEEHVYSRAADLVDKVPLVGPYASTAISAAPNAITGLAVGAALGTAAVGSLTTRLPRQVSGILGIVAASAPLVGFVMDWPSIRDAFMPSESLAGLAWNPLGALALENMGGLAYEPMGGLAVEGLPFGDALGDGMAWEVAPISATAYTQASLADAAYSGADFSVSEGQALLNGTFGSAYGLPPQRQAAHPSGASHLAGRPGHRWGWLIQTVGPDEARRIAAMSPGRRTRTIKKLRREALATHAQNSALQAAQSAQNIAHAHGATAAVATVGGHAGPAAPGGPSTAYGAALFVGD